MIANSGSLSALTGMCLQRMFKDGLAGGLCWESSWSKSLFRSDKSHLDKCVANHNVLAQVTPSVLFTSLSAVTQVLQSHCKLFNQQSNPLLFFQIFNKLFLHHFLPVSLCPNFHSCLCKPQCSLLSLSQYQVVPVTSCAAATKPYGNGFFIALFQRGCHCLQHKLRRDSCIQPIRNMQSCIWRASMPSVSRSLLHVLLVCPPLHKHCPICFHPELLKF